MAKRVLMAAAGAFEGALWGMALLYPVAVLGTLLGLAMFGVFLLVPAGAVVGGVVGAAQEPEGRRSRWWPRRLVALVAAGASWALFHFGGR